MDLDEICITNVNRQLHAMDGQIGRQKTEAMADRARAIHPAAEVTVVPRFFNEGTAAEILDAGFDAVIDAIDSTRHKALLLACCRERGIFTVTCGGAGGRRDPTRIRVADLAYSGKDPLLHQLRRSLRHDHGFPKTPMGVKPDPLGIDAVFSDEPQVFIQCDGSVSDERPDTGGQRLACAGGLGSVTHVTAAFGMIAAGRVLERLVENGITATRACAPRPQDVFSSFANCSAEYPPRPPYRLHLQVVFAPPAQGAVDVAQRLQQGPRAFQQILVRLGRQLREFIEPLAVGVLRLSRAGPPPMLRNRGPASWGSMTTHCWRG